MADPVHDPERSREPLPLRAASDAVSVDAISLDSVDEASGRSDVSGLNETHTADTAPASLPPAADVELASPPPSDVFAQSSGSVPSEPPALPPLPFVTPGFGDPLSRAARRGGRDEPRHGPYWEWALLGFCGTLLLVVIVLRYRGVPVLSAGVARHQPVVVAAPLRAAAPEPPVAMPAPEVARPAPPPAQPSAAPAVVEPPRRRAPRAKRSRRAQTPAVQAPAPPRPTPARDSVRAGLAQELP
jgi:hypothetical protein